MSERFFVVAGQSNALRVANRENVETYLDTSSQTGTVVSLTEGGTTLFAHPTRNDWYPFEDGLSTTGELLDMLIAQVDGHLASHPDDDMVGLLWVQGESDAQAYASAGDDYEANLEKLISVLRERYGDNFVFTIVQLSDQMPASFNAKMRENWPLVQEAQQNIADKYDFVSIIDPDTEIAAAGYEFEDILEDDIHYNNTGTQVIADAFMRQFESAGTDGNDLLFGDASDNLTTGGLGHDTVFGNAGNDTLYGHFGSDILHGNEGDDVIYAGRDNDTVYGGEGQDTLWGGKGNDFVYGQGGDDLIYGGNGNDWLDGGDGNDTIYGQSGNDTITGNEGNDLIFGSVGHDQLYGHFGDDVLHGEDGNDALYGGRGNDMLFGGTGQDTLVGASGSDTLDGQDGDDLLLGGDGFDFIFSGQGSDTINGGRHADTVIYDDITYADAVITTSNATLTLTHMTGTDTLVNVEFLQFADGTYDIAAEVFSPDPDTLL